MKKVLFAVIVAALLFSPGVGAAQIKQWRDADDVLHFQNTKQITLEVRPPIDYEMLGPAMRKIISHDLRLPVISPRLLPYQWGTEFEWAMTAELGIDGRVAARLAKFATAVTLRNTILINEQRLREKDEIERIWILAHEMAHVAQQTIEANGYGSQCAHWLIEGSAEWIARKIVERLGVEASTLHAPVATGSPGSPTLDELTRYEQWIDLRSALGPEATYGQAQFAADELIQQLGLPATLACLNQKDATRLNRGPE